MKLIDAASWYIDKGFSIIPVRDKLPTIKWKDFQTRLATEAEIKAWFGNEEGLAIITGKQSNLTVVDADSAEAVKLVEDTLSGIEVPTVTTPGGGKHFYFSYLSSTRNVQGIKDKLDIRSEGGYVVAPPTERNGAGPYKWALGKNLQALDLLPMPKALVSILYSNITGPLGPVNNTKVKSSTVDTNSIIGSGQNAEVRHERDGKCNIDAQSETSEPKRNNVLQGVTGVTKIPVGKRDSAMFHTANCLIKGGMHPDSALKILTNMSQTMCEEPFPEKEVIAKIQSAVGRDSRYKRSWKEEVIYDLQSRTGEFSQVALYLDLDAKDRSEKASVRITLKRLSEMDDPIIVKCQRDGWYKMVEGVPEENEWKNASLNTYDIQLPFGLSDYVDICPGDVLLFAGSPASGKTATMLDIAIRNHQKHLIKYWSTEVSPAGLKLKLSRNPDINFGDLNLKHYNYSNPHQLDPAGFNIVDYIEAFEKPHMIAQELKNIHSRMSKGGGICIACIQKDPSKTYGWGGFITRAKPILVVGLDQKNDVVKVTVGKATNTPMIDPTGYVGYCKVTGGSAIEMVQPLERKEKQEVL